MRAINRAAVLRALKDLGSVSRAGIARHSGMSQVTVGSIVADLLDRELLVEGDEAPSNGGRPSRLLLLNAAAYAAVGLKLTEDHVVGAITDLEANVTLEATRPLTGRTPEAVADLIAETVTGLLKESGTDRHRLLGVGVGMAGVVDGTEGVCRHSPFLRWRDVPIGALVGDRVQVPVLVENDVNTLALAERWFGAGRGERDFLLVTVGRGVGLGIVADGSLYRGAGGAGEFGHTVVDGSTRVCTCGRTGCLETIVGEAGLIAAAREVGNGRRPRRPRDLGDLYLAVEDDPDLRNVVEDAGRALGRGIANLVNLFAPRLVIVSGEVLHVSSVLVESATAAIDDHVFPGLEGSFEVVAEPLPESAWARGAASLVLSEIFETPTRTQLDLLSALGAGGGA
ncbi:MAG: ROK family protein [Actinobacteria bacterium]|nr:ROK family protein [Actinomycetota bacterium]